MRPLVGYIRNTHRLEMLRAQCTAQPYLLGVKGSVLSCDALSDDLGGFVNENSWPNLLKAYKLSA